MPSRFSKDLIINVLGNLCGWIALGLATTAVASSDWASFGNEVAGLFQVCIANTGNCREPNSTTALVAVRALLVIFIIFAAFATCCNLAALCLIESQAFLRKVSLALYGAAETFGIATCVVYTVANPNNRASVVFGIGFRLVWTAFAFITLALAFQALSVYYLRKLRFLAV